MVHFLSPQTSLPKVAIFLFLVMIFLPGFAAFARFLVSHIHHLPSVMHGYIYCLWGKSNISWNKHSWYICKFPLEPILLKRFVWYSTVEILLHAKLTSMRKWPWEASFLKKESNIILTWTFINILIVYFCIFLLLLKLCLNCTDKIIVFHYLITKFPCLFWGMNNYKEPGILLKLVCL